MSSRRPRSQTLSEHSSMPNRLPRKQTESPRRSEATNRSLNPEGMNPPPPPSRPVPPPAWSDGVMTSSNVTQPSQGQPLQVNPHPPSVHDSRTWLDHSTNHRSPPADRDPFFRAWYQDDRRTAFTEAKGKEGLQLAAFIALLVFLYGVVSLALGARAQQQPQALDTSPQATEPSCPAAVSSSPSSPCDAAPLDTKSQSPPGPGDTPGGGSPRHHDDQR